MTVYAPANSWEGVGTSNFTTTTGDFFQNIENGFLVDHYIEIDKDHYYENHNVEKNVKRTGGGRNVDDQNVDRPKISERRNGLFS